MGKVKENNRLVDRFPELAREWHPTKNTEFHLELVTCGLAKRVWWQCNKGHEWATMIFHRTRNGTGCPACTRRAVTADNNLSVLEPSIAQEWHPTRNEGITPLDVRPGTDAMAWWLCEEGHEWEALIYSRTGKYARGCPYCSRSRVHPTTCLAVTHPEVAKQWHPSKNNDLTPQDVLSGTNEEVWWLCDLNHEWQRPVQSRTTAGSGCPTCRNMSSSKTERTIYYFLKSIFEDTEHRYKHVVGNKKVETDVYIPSLNVAIEYDGEYYHKDKVKKDTLKNALLESIGVKIIRIRESELPKITPNDIVHTFYDQYSIHTSLASILSILKSIENNISNSLFEAHLLGSDQPNDYYFNTYLPRIAKLEKSLETEYPDVAKEWHPTKNGLQIPSTTAPATPHYAWWQCRTCDHEWRTKVSNRTVNMRGCPKCYGNAVTEDNNFAFLHPELATEWHPTKNEKQPTEFRQKSTVKVWWLGKCGHEWEASVGNRVKGKGCPQIQCCRKGKSETIEEGYPHLLKEWMKEKNKKLGLSPSITAGSKKVAWWKCSECSGEFQMVIKYRKYGSGCPECRKKKIIRNPNSRYTS